MDVIPRVGPEHICSSRTNGCHLGPPSGLVMGDRVLWLRGAAVGQCIMTSLEPSERAQNNNAAAMLLKGSVRLAGHGLYS